MKQIWAPWRMKYIAGPKSSKCIFCNNDEGLTLYREVSAGVKMNKYPYNNGHLMVYPLRHIACLEDLESSEASHLFSVLKRSVLILKETFNPDGFNIGLNLGVAAGAGIEDHIHFHIVPRWKGDTNFMPIVGEVRVMPEHLKSTYDRLYPRFQGL
ncbi:MAG: HIT domain-containing protein [Deltaproteobacteria bacterium]|nr:HIT domain-containing protein [Deltaproteobacteria bacterium]